MSRWGWKRWAWGVLAGAAVATSSGYSAGDDKPTAPELPKPNDTITLRFDGQPEQKVTVIKSTRKPDGAIETEVKDPATGQTFTLYDPPPGTKPETPTKPSGMGSKQTPSTGGKTTAGSTDTPTPPPAVKQPILPRAKPRTDDPLTPLPPATAATTPDTPQDKRGLGARLFGKEQPNNPVATPAAPAPTTPPAEPAKKPGLFARIFGPKKSATPTPAATTMPSPGRSTSPGTAPSTPNVGGSVSTPSGGSTTDLPRAMPPRPFLPPTAATPVPSPLPSAIPQPPAPPAGVPIPAIPLPPGSSQSIRLLTPGQPIAVVLPVGYVPAEIALAEDIRPYATALQSALAPSARMTAAKGLADGRHGSSDQVKGLLFEATQTDPCPAVRACCIEHLCQLGYYHPAFLAYLQKSVNDPSEDVREAAKVALVKMSPKP
jgi:hypothetical protein